MGLHDYNIWKVTITTEKSYVYRIERVQEVNMVEDGKLKNSDYGKTLYMLQ